MTPDDLATAVDELDFDAASFVEAAVEHLAGEGTYDGPRRTRAVIRARIAAHLKGASRADLELVEYLADVLRLRRARPNGAAT